MHFELGGKSANIVFDDADFDRALDGSLVNIFSNSGQICIAGSRILVQRGIAEAFIEAFVARTVALTVGDPLDPQTEVRPMAFEAHFCRVLSSTLSAPKPRARATLRRRSPQQIWVRVISCLPPVFQVTHNQLSLCQEEVFGPVVSIQVFDNDDEALEVANDSRFGLVGYCWTGSLARAQAFQRQVEAGTLWINTPFARDFRAPFGGFKESGIGRDGPRQAAEFFTKRKPPSKPLGSGPMADENSVPDRPKD